MPLDHRRRATLDCGVTICAPGFDATCLAERIRVNAGTNFVANLEIEQPHYYPEGVVPAHGWRRASERELQLLTGSGAVGIPKVALVKIPDYIVQELLDARGDGFGQNPNRGFGYTIKSPIPDPVSVKIDRALSRLEAVSCSSIADVIFTYNHFCRRTLGLDRERNLLPGLHFDTLDKLPLSRLHEALTRLTINVGRRTRYFMFLNLTPRQLMEKMQIEFEDSCNPNRVGKEFCRKFPDYPVVRVETKPGEAYVAPTDYLLHDAAAIDFERHCSVDYESIVDDWLITIRGRFRLNESDATPSSPE